MAGPNVRPNFTQLYHDNVMDIWHATGTWKEPISTYALYNPDDTAVNDSFAFCSVECAGVGYNLNQHHIIPAWTDINGYGTSGGPKALLFREDWEYWCACDAGRIYTPDAVDYTFKGKLVRPQAGQSGTLDDTQTGDYIIVLRGTALIAGTEYTGTDQAAAVFIAPQSGNLPVQAVTDVIAIRARAVPQIP